jgi:hypothetical protein
MMVGATLVVVEAVAPGTVTQVVTAVKGTVDPSLDGVADTTANHAVPAASNTLGAARDGLAETNILGDPEPAPVWAQPQDGG